MEYLSENKIKAYTAVLYGLAVLTLGIAGVVAVEVTHRI
jgi:hypothetical protein